MIKKIAVTTIIIITLLTTCLVSSCAPSGERAENGGAESAISAGTSSDGSADDFVPERTDVTFDMAVIKESSGSVEKGSAVSPFVFGEFLEHIPGCIYGAIWSELLLDRKFYYPAGETGLSPWAAIGDVTSVTDTYSLNGYAPKLSQDGLVSQKVSLIANDYVGYFYAKGGGRVRVTVGAEFFEFDTTDEYKKYEYSFTLNAAGSCTAAFACLSGNVTLDSVSLMPADNYHGMRRDTLDAMKSLSGTIYRWPGGNFVSGYNWKDGIGDRDKRVCRRNSAWFVDNGDVEADKKKLAEGDFYGRIEPNDMGTDEFLLMCEYIGATPYLAVNTGSGSVEDAVDLINYCNTTNTAYGKKRMDNGHIAPYNVKYWCIGNEMQGDWQIGHTSSDNYVVRHNAFVTAMRAVDDSIVVTGCGDNYSDWSDGMMKNCAANLDYIGEHLYADRKEENDLRTHITATLDNFSMRIRKHRELIGKYPAAKNVKIAFDEYAYNWNGHPTLRDALGIAATLDLFIDNADVVGMANYSDAVFVNTKKNAPGALYAYKDKIEMTPVGYVLKAFAENTYENQASINVKKTDSTVNLYYSATVSSDGKKLSIAFVNASVKSVGINPKFAATVAKKVSVTAESESSTDAVYEESFNLKRMVLKPLSVTVFTLSL